jgi:hypothetical protein
MMYRNASELTRQLAAQTNAMVMGPTGPTGSSQEPYEKIKFKYIIRFNKPVNIVELFGHIIETTKDREMARGLFTQAIHYNAADISDTIIFVSCSYWGHNWIPNIYIHILNTLNGISFKDLAEKRDDKEYIAGVIAQLNSSRSDIIDTIVEVTKNWGLDEGAIKDAMAPAAVAAMLAASESESDDGDDMLDKLEAFAAECDKKTSPMVSHGWEIDWG